MASGGTRTLRVVIAGDGSGAIRVFNSLNQGIDGAGRGVDNFGRRSGGAFGIFGAGALGALGKIGAIGAAAGLGIATKKAYDLGRAFEQNLFVLDSLDKKFGFDNFKKGIQEQSLELAKLGYSTGEASAAVVELVKAGLDGSVATKSLTDAMVLARGGGLELADSAAAISNALNVFNNEGLKAGDVANILANAANESTASVGNLLESMQMSSAVAAQAGLSYSETAAALAIMANNGIKGSDAGTSLKTMLLRLRAPVEGSKAALDKLGVSVFDSENKMKPFTQIIGELAPKLQALDEQARAQALYKIFGSDAIRAATVLLGDKALPQFEEMVSKVQRAGAAAETANARTAGLGGAIDRLQALAKTGGERLYLAFGPALGAAMNGVIDKVMQFSTAMSNLRSGNIDAFAAVMDNIFGGNGRLVSGFKTVGTFALKMKEALTKSFDDAKSGAGFFGQVMDRLKPIIKQVQDTVGKFAGFIRADLLPVFQDILKKAKPVLEQLKSTFLTVLEAIKVAIKVFTVAVQVLWFLFGGIILNAVKGFMAGILQAFKGALQIIQGVLNIFIGLFTGNWSKMWSGIKGIFVGAFNLLVGLLRAWLNGSVLAIFRGGLLSVLNIVRGAWGSIRGATVSAFNAIRGVVTGAMGATRGVISTAVNGIRNFFSSMWLFLVSRTTTGASSVRRVFEQLGAQIISRLASIPGRVASIGGQIIQGIINGIRARIGGIGDIIASVANMIPDGIKKVLNINSPSRVTTELGMWAGEGLIQGLASKVTGVKTMSNIMAAAAKVDPALLGVSLGELMSAQARALQTAVDKAKVARDEANLAAQAMGDASKNAAAYQAGLYNTAQAASTAYNKAKVAADSVTVSQNKLAASAKAAADAKRKAAQAALYKAQQMPSLTKAQKAAKDAAMDHARALGREATIAADNAKRVKAAADVKIKAAKDAAAAAKKLADSAQADYKKYGDAAKEAAEKAVTAAEAAAKAQADLADAIYQEQVETAKGLADTVMGQLTALAEKAKGLKDSFKNAVLADAGLGDAYNAQLEAAKAAYEKLKAAKDGANANAADSVEAEAKATAELNAALNAMAQVQADMSAADAASEDGQRKLAAASREVAEAQAAVAEAAAKAAAAMAEQAKFAEVPDEFSQNNKSAFQGIIDYLTGKLTDATTFAANIGQLSGMGLSESLITQLTALGPKAGNSLAQAIVDAGPEGIAKINELNAQIEKVATTGLDELAGKLYGPGASALAAYIGGLRSQFPELEKTLNEAAAMVSQIMGQVAAGKAAAAELASVSASNAAAQAASRPGPILRGNGKDLNATINFNVNGGVGGNGGFISESEYKDIQQAFKDAMNGVVREARSR